MRHVKENHRVSESCARRLESAPVILLLPGTCCHWKGNFEKVIPLLACRPEQWAILVKSIMEGKQ